MVSVGLDASAAREQMRKQLIELGPKEILKIGHRAINRAIQAGNTEMSKQIRQTVNLRASTVKEHISITKSSGTRAVAELKASVGEGIPLSEYGGSFGKKGMTVRVEKGGKRSRIESAFAILTKKGKVRAYERAEDSRYPIELMFGPSVKSQAERALPAVDKRAREILERRLIAEIEQSVEKASKA